MLDNPDAARCRIVPAPSMFSHDAGDRQVDVARAASPVGSSGESVSLGRIRFREPGIRAFRACIERLAWRASRQRRAELLHGNGRARSSGRPMLLV
jgi:hypothetical protein